ncbi:hypothetical protein MMC07_003891 [Pseudocyphellaria aurata]|nr:hypothetical protein [Pseudocyphellaria aurata]
MANLPSLEDVSFAAVAKALSASFVVLFVALLFLVVKRLFFHPLSKIPGPKLAAATGWYEFYYDVIRNGAYSHQFEEFHERYASSIIRISPNHVHIKDPYFFSEIFSPRSEFYKAPEFYDGVGVPGSIIMLRDPHKHRIRRNMLNPLFSSRSIDSMSLRTSRTVQRALRIALSDFEAGKETNIQQLFRRITLDSICETAFGHSYNSLDDGEEESEFLTNLDMFLTQVRIGIHFPIIIKISMNLPEIIANRIASGYMRFRAQCTGWINDVIEKRSQGIYNDKFERQYAFDLLLEPQPVKDYVVPSAKELVDEALVLIVAGTDTTTYALTHATYHILRHSDVLKRLQEELQQTLNENEGRLEWATIRQLPYLTAIIQESLRLSPPVPGGLPRVVPPQGVRYGSHTLAGGTTVSTALFLIHKDPRLFPDPETFNPDRWLGEEGKKLKKWNVAFSSGTRGCIGINLAYQELYLCLALFFSKFEMELFDTDASSVEWDDYGTARNRRPVKVKVKSILT